jgi:hypothetical protein
MRSHVPQRAPPVTTLDALGRMRCAAALLACTPDLSARLVYDDVIIVEVMRPPFPMREHAVLPPCWFRGLVADGVQDPAAGTATQERMERLVACRIDLGIRNGAAVLPGEVVRLDAGETWRHLLAVAAPIDEVEPVAHELAAELGDVADDIALELHALDDVRVTVLAQVTARSEAASDAGSDRLRTVAMRVAIARLERELACTADHPARRTTSSHPDNTHKDS